MYIFISKPTVVLIAKGFAALKSVREMDTLKDWSYHGNQ